VYLLSISTRTLRSLTSTFWLRSLAAYKPLSGLLLGPSGSALRREGKRGRSGKEVSVSSGTLYAKVAALKHVLLR